MNQAIQTNQLNPYAIQLCALSRWVSQRQWLPLGSGVFSVRTSEHSALFTDTDKDKNELSPADLLCYDWRQQNEASTATAIHQFLYQQNPHHKVVLQTHAIQTTVFSLLIQADQHLFVGYELQQRVALTQAQRDCCPLAIFDPQSTALTLQELRHRFERDTLPFAFLIRGHGLYVWGDSIDSAKRHLETWQFLISCELERMQADIQAQ
jgi:methylthioribulose-1-phosphate dehydratase